MAISITTEVKRAQIGQHTTARLVFTGPIKEAVDLMQQLSGLYLWSPSLDKLLPKVEVLKSLMEMKKNA